MRKFFERSLGSLLMSFLATLASVPSLAISSSELDMFSQNNILFYDPDGSECGSIAVGSFDGVGSAGLSDLQATFVDTYHDIAQNLSVEYGIPWETVVAQGILESASGTSSFARDRNNFFGIGAFDSNPNNAFSYDTPEDGWRGYYENIRKTATYRNHGVFSGETITNPYAYAQAIKDAGYATDSNYVSKLSTLIAAIENRAQERGWKLSAELAKVYPEMISNAGINSSGSESMLSLATTSGCISSVSGNPRSGSINETALDLSWSDKSHPKNSPKPEYVEAMKAVGTYYVPYGHGVVPPIGASCDQFVATVMRYSGADPNFPSVGTADLLNYLSSRKDLYEEIPNIGSTANLQPGDIRAKVGHIEMVVQLDDGTFKIASASHNDRTGDHATNFYADSSYRIFRRKW